MQIGPACYLIITNPKKGKERDNTRSSSSEDDNVSASEVVVDSSDSFRRDKARRPFLVGPLSPPPKHASYTCFATLG